MRNVAIATASSALFALTACNSLQDSHGQPAWTLASDSVSLTVTEKGAQTAPVIFFRNNGPVAPYYISPWQGEALPMPCPVMAPLRGDFLCLPFGGNGEPFCGEQHPPHGETAGSAWELASVKKKAGRSTLTLELEPRVREGKITRALTLVDGENAVYSCDTVEGFKGQAPFAHHAILALPEKEGALLVSTSPFAFGLTCPWLFSDPKNKEYQSLAIGREFWRLDQVPGRFADQPVADCSAFPARFGYADLLQLNELPQPGNSSPSWVAAVNTEEHYLWFALKDPKLMPGRVFWMENHGRHASPWNGRNACLGIEDGCMFFDNGIAGSCRPNVLNSRGIPTSREFDGKPFAIRYIQGCAKVPPGFGRVANVLFAPGRVSFIDDKGQQVVVKVRHEFLATGQL